MVVIFCIDHGIFPGLATIGGSHIQTIGANGHTIVFVGEDDIHHRLLAIRIEVLPGPCFTAIAGSDDYGIMSASPKPVSEAENRSQG